jgi:FkbM family methyltransferase
MLLSQVLPLNFSSLDSRDLVLRPSNSLEESRWQTISTKEPETIEWLNNMELSSTYIDIGANIGIYTAAAWVRGVEAIIAFEPFLKSFESLTALFRSNNIYSSYLFNMGLARKSHLVSLFGQSDISGAAEFSYSSNFVSASSVTLLTPFEPFLPLIQTKRLYIKIDVDGEEVNVIGTVLESLPRDLEVSCMIEIDLSNTDAVTASFGTHGYTLDKYYEGYRPHSVDRRQKELNNTARNHVFKNF